MALIWFPKAAYFVEPIADSETFACSKIDVTAPSSSLVVPSAPVLVLKNLMLLGLKLFANSIAFEFTSVLKTFCLVFIMFVTACFFHCDKPLRFIMLLASSSVCTFSKNVS